jgi:hypothetical protein
MKAVVIVAVVAILAHHADRQLPTRSRPRPPRGVNLFWSGVRSPYITIPGPFGTRIGHRL